jgi:hypothetical protein
VIPDRPAGSFLAPANRRRRILRWTAIAAVAMTVLLASYVSAWIAWPRVYGHGMLSVRTEETIEATFKPLDAYCTSDLPGGGALLRLYIRLNPPPEPDRPL